MSNKVVAQSVQTAGNVGQTHGYLYEQADPGLGTTLLNHTLVHLEQLRIQHFFYRRHI